MKVGSYQNDFMFCSKKSVVPHMWFDQLTYMERSTHICELIESHMWNDKTWMSQQKCFKYDSYDSIRCVQNTFSQGRRVWPLPCRGGKQRIHCLRPI